jgi:hypothetical protein
MEDQRENARVLNEIHFVEAFALPQWQAAVDRFPSWMPRLVNCKVLGPTTSYHSNIRTS